MRVVMVILEYAPITGGAQRQLAALAPRLARAGVDVQVITRRKPGLAASERVDGVCVHRLPAPGPRALASLVFTLAALLRLRALRPDVVHAYSLFSPATIAVLARALFGLPAVVKVLRGGVGGDVERLRRKPFAALRIAALRRAVARFVAISDEIERELASLGVDARRVVALPNGVDLARFHPPAAGERAAGRRALGWPDGPLVLFVGRLVAEKRVAALVAAWPSVRASVPGATLCVAGEGPERAALADLVRSLSLSTSLSPGAGEGVRLLGEIADPAPLLRAADLFVLPSAAEGLSNALLEAMASGLPVVATRVGGALDVVRDGASGRLVPAGDDGALVRALVAGLDPAQAEQNAALGRAAREHVAAHHSLEAVAQSLVGLYAAVARGAAGGARPLAAAEPRHALAVTEPRNALAAGESLDEEARR